MHLLVLQTIIFLFLSIYTYIAEDLYLSSSIAFWSLLLIIILEYVKTKGISLIFIFLISFLYMIPVEGILNYSTLYNDWGKNTVDFSFFLLICSAFLVFIGFNFVKIKPYVLNLKEIIFNPKKLKSLIFIIVCYNIFYFIFHLEMIVNNLTLGRGAVETTFNIQLTAIALIFLTIIAITVKNKFKVILIILPTLLVLIGTGTRLFLVYAILMLMTKDIISLPFKKSIKVLLISIPILLFMNFIKSNRSSGLLNTNDFKEEKIIYETFTQKVASYGSTEGLLRNIAMITDYTNNHDYTYGKSIGFLSYWWVPRSIWDDKPVMLDYWLIREYRNDFSGGYSTASSYYGEIYMDFGPFISMVICLFLGILLGKLQNWINVNLNNNFETLIIGSFLYAWIFFGTRSIMTATFMLMWVILFSKIIYFIFKKYRFIL